MQITTLPTSSHEEVLRVSDDATGLVGFIAIHSTQLGPAAGGLRMKPYASEEAALTDALLRAGATEAQVAKVMGGNMLRVLRARLD